MTRLSTANRYAQAVFELAQEHDDLAKWQEDLSRLATLVEENQLRDFLDAPLIPEADKLAALKQLLPESQPLLHNLAGLMLRNGVVSLLPLVSQEFQRLLDQQQGIARVRVTTAIPVGPDVVESIRQKIEAITGKNILATVEVTPSILGGFIAQVGDRLIDGSTRTRLKELRGKMIAGQ